MDFLDVSGIFLTPSENGELCLGNGTHQDKDGNLIDCCCDECPYFLECFPEWM